MGMGRCIATFSKPGNAIIGSALPELIEVAG